jgi:MoxR-like ATPase
MDTPFENRIDFTELKEKVAAIRQSVGQVVIGQQNMLDLIITALLADGHILLEGVPGVAKTLTAKLVARTIHADFSRIQFTPDLMPSDVIGTLVFDSKKEEFTFRKGPIFANMVLIDEINRSPAKTQAALFEVMEERQITLDGQQHTFSPPFMVLATQNPIEQEGTYRLPEAQLDRFLFKISVDYPTQQEEETILHNANRQTSRQSLENIQPLLTTDELTRFRDMAYQVHVEQGIISYIATLVQQTRNDPALYLGASPRASVALLNASKAYAALNGRDFVTPEDVKFVALPVLSHRIILSPEKEMEGSTEKQVVNDLLAKVEIPR